MRDLPTIQVIISFVFIAMNFVLLLYILYLNGFSYI